MKAGPWPAARVLRASYSFEFQRPFLQNEPNFLSCKTNPIFLRHLSKLVARYLSSLRSSSSRRTVAVPAYAFESHQSGRGENWRCLRDVSMQPGTASDAGHLQHLKAAGVECIDENGSQPGVRLRTVIDANSGGQGLRLANQGGRSVTFVELTF